MSSLNNRPTTNREFEQIKHRERTERRIERNMFYMSLTLCSISILTRFLVVVVGVYFSFFYSFDKILISILLTNIIYSFGPNVSIFIFYSFNKMFRDETNKKLFRKQPRPQPKIIFISNEVRFWNMWCCRKKLLNIFFMIKQLTINFKLSIYFDFWRLTF